MARAKHKAKPEPPREPDVQVIHMLACRLRAAILAAKRSGDYEAEVRFLLEDGWLNAQERACWENLARDMLEGVDLCLAQNSVNWARLTDGCTIASMSVNVWERQPGESAKAHEAFRSYLALAENRSCTKVAQQLHKSRTLITRWCGRHKWVERSIEYDREMERREREGEIRARVEMRRRHATLALLAQKKVTEAVGKLNPDEMKASGLARLLAESTRLERLARGSDEEDGGFASVNIIVGNRHPDPEDQRERLWLANSDMEARQHERQ